MRWTLYCAWLLSCIGVLVSLFFSELLHLVPCHLCWYQRICLFPLAIILGIASWRGFTGITPYLLPQIVLGLLFALYQVAIQEIPGWNPIDLCGKGHACTEKISIGLGPISIPMLSAAGFFVIGALLVWTTLLAKRGERIK